MGTVEDLDRRRYLKLVHALRVELETHREATALIDEFPQTVDTWLDAAGEAATELRRPLQSGIHPSGALVWAVLVDDDHDTSGQ